MKKIILAIFLVSGLLVGFSEAHALDTNIMITVRAKDALFVGEAMGGAYVIVRDRRDGDILVEGRTSGNSGDKTKIMADPQPRYADFVDENTSKFEFSLDLVEPTPVTVSVSGPGAQGQAMASASADYLLIPGKDYTAGNGILVELPGLVVDVMSPQAHLKKKFTGEEVFPVQVNVTKICGCNIAAESPWPPENYDVEAKVYRDTILLAEPKLEKLDDPSLYGTKLKFQGPGTYRVVVTAFDTETLEGGLDSTTIVLEP